MVLFASSGEAADRNVVLLQSSERGNLVLDRFTAMLRMRLGGYAEPLTLTEFVVNPGGFSSPPEQAMVDFLQSAFAGRPRPALVITVGGLAAAFFQRHRAQLFPGSPVLYASLDRRWSNDFTDRETSVMVSIDPAARIAEMVRLLPATENIFMVVGGGALSRFWRGVLEQESSQFRERLQFLWPDGMSYAAMLQRASTLPARSVIFFTSTFEVDAEGATFSTERVLADLRERANAPIFGVLSPELGHGAVGGRLIDVDALSRTTADVAFRILGGTAPGLIKMPSQEAGAPVFDWRELQRWGISENRLPAGSVVRFREPGVWQRFKWVIVGSVAALIAQSLLITGLLVNRVRRRRAEQAVRESEGRFRVRLIEAQEQERSRLARELHDDVCQQMTLLAMDMERLGENIPESEADARQQASTLHKEVTALTVQVSGISHRLHSAKLDLFGLAAAAETFSREVSSRSGMAVEFMHDNVPPTLPTDIAVNLFRVLQEALSNAAKHAGASRCQVSLRGADGHLQLAVRDEGRGFDTEAALATSGLGLVSMQERIKLVNGIVAIDSRPGAGTTVHAIVPLAPTGH